MGEEIRDHAIKRVAELMCAAAITAPKAMGVNKSENCLCYSSKHFQ